MLRLTSPVTLGCNFPSFVCFGFAKNATILFNWAETLEGI